VVLPYTSKLYRVVRFWLESASARVLLLLASAMKCCAEKLELGHFYPPNAQRNQAHEHPRSCGQRQPSYFVHRLTTVNAACASRCTVAHSISPVCIHAHMKQLAPNTATATHAAPQQARRAWLITAAALSIAALAGAAGYAAGAYREAVSGARRRVDSLRSQLANAGPHGALEYAVAGHSTPLLMVHGTGGGFDQGLLFAHALKQRGFAVMAPSRFGYLRSSFPQDAQAAAAQKAGFFEREIFPVTIAQKKGDPLARHHSTRLPSSRAWCGPTAR
jgi:hypothetical protein